ncbi:MULTISPECIES: DUF3139 domain-containing protein [Staphylococcus]|uniref:DUF3139 domain-containing protein n=1 Tax=Staphylococcus pseudoxylosus TaxID=2282419 RepID=A0AAQ0MGS6_9STAP|nr:MULTISPECIES: DUF3139 domain-containing protein [Staphylococcus]MCE5003543.1 DUF3139 domain-containing protein [Staphylococcus pseudoxylosus]MDW8571137.1 DUF3139 domain-containing protein [Staphylococcus shinii]MDW8572957.1 DUF3139 domain-containing protein [Staphylococcus shinii]MDW8798717.1 DUF3139 domain-containing protein [Staphylococcus pseudoxylosus]MEB6035914.1 DUF3139 domain-containing protein [Staphylococcus pseudoxylosus]
MKKKYVITILIILILILLIFGFYKGFKHYQKKVTFEVINLQLEKKNFDEDIVKKKEQYDSKRGVYYYSIVYKKENNITYITELDEDPTVMNIISFKNKSHEIYSYPVDKHGNEIQRNTKYQID